MDPANNIWYPFLLTMIAGLSTGIGSAVSFFAKKINSKLLSIGLGFSAGVMIYISMIEMYPDASDFLTRAMGVKKGEIATAVFFFSGMFLIGLIDKIIPDFENPHEFHLSAKENKNPRLMNVGIMTALAISIHNFPEGIAAFFSGFQEPEISLPIVLAVAIHNIPEGIAVFVTIFAGTGSRKKAFIYSFLSGLSEPIGGLVGYLFLRPLIDDLFFGIILAGIAGIMIFISIDELLPSAEEYGEHHLSIYALVAGMMLMAAILVILP